MPKPALIEFTHPRKSMLEELLLIDQNLHEVVESLQELLKRVSTRKVSVSTTPPDSIYARSLYCFAAVSYMRCFTPGYRVKLEISKIRGVTFVDRKLHEDIRGIRNKYLAHAVDSAHEGAYLYLRSPHRGAPPTEFTTLSVVMACDAPPTLRHFIRLVGKVRAHLRKRTAEIGNEVAKSVFGPRATWQRLYPAARRRSKTPNLSLNPDASPAALTRRPLGAG